MTYELNKSPLERYNYNYMMKKIWRIFEQDKIGKYSAKIKQYVNR